MKIVNNTSLKNQLKSTQSTNPFSRVKLDSKSVLESMRDGDVSIRITETKPQKNPSVQLRLVEDDSNNQVYIRVSTFDENGEIRLYGEYQQNFVDFPSYDLSKVRVLDDISFRFFLTIKETTSDSNPIVYTSKSFYDELINSYKEENPYMVQNAVKSEFILNLVVDTYKNKIEELRRLELDLPIQELYVGGLLVNKNLFMNSNYKSTNGGDVKEFPTYDIDELVRYVDWVVSKPSADYDNRLLDERTIGDWNSPQFDDVVETTTTDNTPTPDEPSTNITNPNNSTNYNPIGRAGSFINETVEADDGFYYQWTGTEWEETRPDDYEDRN
jgi:hypothetical protein